MARHRMQNPDDVAKKWAANLAGATNAIKAGVQAVTESPTEAAAARADAYVMGVQEAVTSGRWQAGLRRVTLAQWQNAMITKGLPRIAGGAQAAIPKFTDFLRRWLSYMQQVQQGLLSMPRGNLQQNIARAVYVIEQAAAFSKNQGGF